ncbi:MAG: LysR family transcriptional regulator [Rhodospirillales bacterium]|nr:LysR family transcriptional regulator [Rhodospirillales bacterium]
MGKDKSSNEIKLRLKVRLPNGSLGPGKIKLLELIEAEGSISGAARVLGLSFRRAWHLIDTLNAALKSPVINATPGGKKGGGAELTEHGHKLIDLYREAEEHANANATNLSTYLKLEAEKTSTTVKGDT